MHTHTWSSGQPTLWRPGSSWGFGALLKGHTSVVDNYYRSRDSNPQPQVTSPMLYPLGHDYLKGYSTPKWKFFNAISRQFVGCCSEHHCTCCAQTPQIKRSTGSCMHNSSECRLYSIRIKRRYAVSVLKGHRERDIVKPPTPVQIAPELPTATMLCSGNYSCGARNLVGPSVAMQT